MNWRVIRVWHILTRHEWSKVADEELYEIYECPRCYELKLEQKEIENQ